MNYILNRALPLKNKNYRKKAYRAGTIIEKFRALFKRFSFLQKEGFLATLNKVPYHSNE